ncbi:hypothetical protein [Variovorax sp. KK3]|uniref:hypothetical protein n=1 Tax=Variovorax sp. KK3 TaxID=1855728 RepID=UPI00117C9429|nr:hypothetical protein [Variovorax sp. KK3]
MSIPLSTANQRIVAGHTAGHRPRTNKQIMHTFSPMELAWASDQRGCQIIIHHGAEDPGSSYIKVHSHIEILLLYARKEIAREGLSAVDVLAALTARRPLDVDILYHAGTLYDRALQYIIDLSGEGGHVSDKITRSPSYISMAKESLYNRSAILVGLRSAAVGQTDFEPCLVNGISPLESCVDRYPFKSEINVYMADGENSMVAKDYLRQIIARVLDDQRCIFTHEAPLILA